MHKSPTVLRPTAPARPIMFAPPRLLLYLVGAALLMHFYLLP